MTSDTTASGEDTENSILVTGSTGNLGRHVIDRLRDAGIDPGEIAGLARDPEKASDLADRGIDVRIGDYTEPDTLSDAVEGIDRLLLISSNEAGERVEHHQNVIDAAERHDVGFIAYTSVLNADSSPMGIADEHIATEEMIRESGMDYTILRNGWYTENYTEQLDQALEQGAFVGCTDGGRISAATRSDYAEAAVTVLTEEGHTGEVYELGGDEAFAFTMAELAEEVARQSDTEVAYQDLSREEYVNALTEQGIPESQASVLVDMDHAIAEGALYTESDDLHQLIGHPTTPMAYAVATALSE
jgi:NAD(P)H dehydrogenase (quinone)